MSQKTNEKTGPILDKETSKKSELEKKQGYFVTSNFDLKKLDEIEKKLKELKE